MNASPSTPPLTRRQRDILEFLRAYTAEHDISPTLEEIASAFGVNKVTIFGHIGELERKGIIERAARGVSRGLRIVEADTPIRPGATPTVPILGLIAAGQPLEAVEAPEELDLSTLIPDGGEVYALRVRGDSMIEDAICDGDIVLVERRATASDGETVVAVLGDEEATLKRFYREGAGVRLQPANQAMDPILVDEVEVRGVVIGVVRQF